MISSLKLIKKITIFNLCFLLIITSCTDQKKTNDNYEPEILPNQAIFEKPIDLSIKNILIYPNQFDKNSVYVDTEILSERGGEGDIQISLINDDELVISHSIKIKSNISNYFQSFFFCNAFNFINVFIRKIIMIRKKSFFFNFKFVLN